MKGENREELERQTHGQPFDESRKKPEKARKERSDLDLNGVRLPVLVEFAYTVSILILLFLGLTVAVTSFLTGASLLAVILRTGVAMAVIGGLLMLIASQVSSGMLFAQKVEQEEQAVVRRAEPEVPSSLEAQDRAEAS